ncbi:hypothetical protein ACEQ8H_001042 [Pleosporales sp. CAS-2024a]
MKTHVPVPGSKPTPKPKPKDASAKSQLSQEFVGSDDDSAVERAPQWKPTNIAVHHAKAAVRTKQTNLAGRDARASDSDSDSESDSSLDESAVNGAPQPTPQPATAQSSRTQPHAVEFHPAQTFVPPKGFSAVSSTDKTTSKATHIFGQLQGKQIWHITAPAAMSLTGVREITMDRALKGGAVLQHKGIDYSFSAPDFHDEGTCAVMVPAKGGYKAVSAPIAQTLRLQAAIQLPKLSSLQADQATGSEAAASITRSTIRAPRPQLRGLKMRFMPTGFGHGDAGTLGDSDSEGEGPRETAGPGMPGELNLPSRKEKRKHVELNGDSRTEAPAKKHKKPRTVEHVQRKEERRAKKEKKRAQEAAAKS